MSSEPAPAAALSSSAPRAKSFESQSPLPSKPKIAGHIGTATNPTTSPETKHRAKMEVALAAERGDPERSEESIMQQIGTATSTKASHKKQHAAREALMSEAGKSAVKE
ncbi:hypothetical protein KFE25_013283 [Diacronema lutheri]|uniref:Uncharacterized protein n=1 Tax=Diacronema lutheri TaxID=2081491 RepID=A0A8J6CFN4_DIALT|nr:hypothetical protein KFE25_013283 [Diacronema lutheri]